MKTSSQNVSGGTAGMSNASATSAESKLMTDKITGREYAERAMPKVTTRRFDTVTPITMQHDEMRTNRRPAGFGAYVAPANKVAEVAGTGGALGAIAGGISGAVAASMAAVKASIAVPGLALVIAGAEAATLLGAGAGCLVGGMLGALVGWGYPWKNG